MRALPHMTRHRGLARRRDDPVAGRDPRLAHPIYILLGKGGDPVIRSPSAVPIGKGDRHDRAEQALDVLFVPTGVATRRRSWLPVRWRRRDPLPGLLHAHTIKPLVRTLSSTGDQGSFVVTVEEHSVVGWTGQRGLCEARSDAIVGPLAAAQALGIPIAFPPHYGSQQR